MVLCNAHTPTGGLVRNGQLLLDFHALPLRIRRFRQTAGGHSGGGLRGQHLSAQQGGRTYSGWTCEHLPYLVELDNWGVASILGNLDRLLDEQ